MKEASRSPRARLRTVLLLVVAAVVVPFLLPAGESLPPAGRRALGAATLIGGLWVTEAVPIPATALLPLALFPTLGVLPIRETTAPYAHPLIFLFMGGFLLARAMERWDLHHRLALRTILLFGSAPARLVAGFMVAAAFLSMWISNAATVVMLTPTAVSVVELVRRKLGREGDCPETADFAGALLIGLAYAGSIGGMATLVGTAPNALMASFYAEHYRVDVDFGTWMRVGLPLVLVFLPLCWWLLVRWIFPLRLPELPGGRAALEGELAELGPLSSAERRVGVVFALTALCWTLRRGIDAWLFAGLPGSLNDASVAMLAGFLLFMIPAGPDAPDEPLLDWETAATLPWGVLLLFGGGLSLAAALTATGVPVWIGELFRGFQGVPDILLILGVATSVILMTEFTSNTATTATLMPVLAGVAEGLGVAPQVLFLPAVFAASCAFMMPVATPPNAIVLASGAITVRQLFRAGIWVNLLGVVLISLYVWGLADLLLAGRLVPPGGG